MFPHHEPLKKMRGKAETCVMIQSHKCLKMSLSTNQAKTMVEVSSKFIWRKALALEPVPVVHLKNRILFSKQNEQRTAPFVYEDVETTYLIDDQYYVDLTNVVPIILTPEQSMVNNARNEDNKGLSPLMLVALGF